MHRESANTLNIYIYSNCLAPTVETSSVLASPVKLKSGEHPSKLRMKCEFRSTEHLITFTRHPLRAAKRVLDYFRDMGFLGTLGLAGSDSLTRGSKMAHSTLCGMSRGVSQHLYLYTSVGNGLDFETRDSTTRDGDIDSRRGQTHR